MRKRVGKMATEIPFPYRVVRSRKRRTASLSIDMGQVEVRVPALVDNAWVEQWLLSKSDWVLPRLAQQREDLADHEIRIEPGAQIFVAGEPRRLKWRRGARSGVVETPDHLEVIISSRVRVAEVDAVHRQLKAWFAERAQSVLPERCEALAEATGLKPAKVVVKDYRRKWGQCSSSGTVSLNWRLVHLAPHLQDYVIIHELCHLKYMNHGREFWGLVHRLDADYDQNRRQLARAYPYLMW